jgi:hypothetical protein
MCRGVLSNAFAFFRRFTSGGNSSVPPTEDALDDEIARIESDIEYADDREPEDVMALTDSRETQQTKWFRWRTCLCL